MDIPTTTSTVITCTKSKFGDALRLAHAVALSDTTGAVDKAELNEVIDGLVRQADQHRGTFTGYNAYLDCQFTVVPDDAPKADLAAERMARGGQLNNVHPGMLRTTSSLVTEIQAQGRHLRIANDKN